MRDNWPPDIENHRSGVDFVVVLIFTEGCNKLAIVLMVYSVIMLIGSLPNRILLLQAGVFY